MNEFKATNLLTRLLQEAGFKNQELNSNAGKWNGEILEVQTETWLTVYKHEGDI